MKRILAAALAAPLFACQPGAPPVVTPVPVPVVVMPPQVQQACQVLTWAVPIATSMANLSPDLQRYVDAAGPALAACAAGNASGAIVELAVALQNLLAQRGVRAPMGMPVLRR